MKYHELQEYYDVYTKAGYDPSLFDVLVTTAPDAAKVMRGASLAGYKAGHELALTPEQLDDTAFVWGYANYLRDKKLLPPAHLGEGSDFDGVRKLYSILLGSLAHDKTNPETRRFRPSAEDIPVSEQTGGYSKSLLEHANTVWLWHK